MRVKRDSEIREIFREELAQALRSGDRLGRAAELGQFVEGQKLRMLALDEARRCFPYGGPAPDAVSLLMVANWILDGNDPDVPEPETFTPGMEAK